MDSLAWKHAVQEAGGKDALFSKRRPQLAAAPAAPASNPWLPSSSRRSPLTPPLRSPLSTSPLNPALATLSAADTSSSSETSSDEEPTKDFHTPLARASSPDAEPTVYVHRSPRRRSAPRSPILGWVRRLTR